MKKALLAFVLLIPAIAYMAVPSATPTPVATATTTAAATAGVPEIIIEGFRAFQTGGYASATSTWTRYSSMSVDSLAIQAVNSVFLTQVNLAGQFTGAEVIRVVNLSISVQEIYVAVKYQRGVLFMGFTCYKLPDKWTVTSMTIDHDPSKVIPTNIMGGL